MSGVASARIERNTQLPQCEIEWLAERAGFVPENLTSNGPAGTCL